MKAPDFLAIGHVSTDVVAQGTQLGGAALYAAITANRLGLRAALLTSAAPAELPQLEALPVALASRTALRTTAFRNTYGPAGRRQRLLARADPLTTEDLPVLWRSSAIVLLAPIAAELAPDLLALFPSSLRGVAVQGWMRRWGLDGQISQQPLPHAGEELRTADVAFLSAEDLPAVPGLTDLYSACVSCLVLTRGAQGADVYWRGARHFTPPVAAHAVDPTGAGDVFAAAFLVRLAEGADPLTAARYAACAAALSVEGTGLAAIPTRAQIASRLLEAS